jgi:hypothetical protein
VTIMWQEDWTRTVGPSSFAAVRSRWLDAEQI